jgi:hypothetical protein
MIVKRLFLAAALLFLLLSFLCFLGSVACLLLLRPILTVLFFLGFIVFGIIALATGVIWFILRIV